MKKFIFILFFISLTAVADEPEYTARLRVNRSAAMSLSTAWQTVQFTGGSTLNGNWFPSVGGVKMVYYDTGTDLFMFSSPNNKDRHYALQFNVSAVTNLVTTRANIQYRFIIPNGISPGIDLAFPNPDGVGFADLIEATVIANTVFSKQEQQHIYTNSALRANGLKLQLRLSQSLITLGTCVTSDINMVIFSESFK